MEDDRIHYDVDAALEEWDRLDAADADQADPEPQDEPQEPAESEDEDAEVAEPEVSEQEVNQGVIQAQLEAFQRRVAEDNAQFRQQVAAHLQQREQQQQQAYQQQNYQPPQQQEYQDPALALIAQHDQRINALQQQAVYVAAYHSRQALDGAVGRLATQFPNFAEVVKAEEINQAFQKSVAAGRFQEPWEQQMINLYKTRTWQDPRAVQDELNAKRQEKQHKTKQASAAAKVATGGGAYQATSPAPESKGPYTYDQAMAAALAEFGDGTGG